MRPLLFGAAICVAVFVTVPPDAAAPGGSHESTVTPSQRATQEDFLTLNTAYVNPPKQVNRLLDLPTELEDRRMLDTSLKTSLFHGRLKSEGEVRYSPPPSSTLEQKGGSDRRLLRFGMTGTQGSFQYGLSMREAGKAVVDGPDLASREMWGEWHLGVARVRTSLGDSWNNVDKDPLRSRITQTQQRIALTLAQPAWPEIAVSYSRAALVSSLDPLVVAAQHRAVDTYEGALGYSGTGWNARATMGYAANADVLTPGRDTRALIYGVNGTYRIDQLFTLSPSLNLRDERQRWSGVRVVSRSGSLALGYTPDPHLSVTALAAYSETHSTDNLFALSALNATSTVTWKPDSLARIHASLSFETSHKVAHNTLSAPQTLEDTSGVVRLQFSDWVIW